MNDNDHAALVEALQETIREAFGYGTVPMEYNSGQMAESFVEQHIDRLLAERQESTVPLDADMVERAAKAIHRRGPASGQDFRYRPETEQEMYRDMARAALAAAGPEEDWLDAALDSVHPLAKIRLDRYEPVLTCDPDAHWIATVRVPVTSHCGHRAYEGTGPTRTAAIRNAVATALAAKQEGDER